MTGHRMSSLPIARFCGRASEHDTGSGRAAVMSTAWHAHLSNRLDPKLIGALTQEEWDEVKSWPKPTDLELRPLPDWSTVLVYDDAEQEVEVELPGVSIGHLDFGWVVDFPDGTKVAYVGDLKKSEWGYPDGIESLQLHAYGLAYSEMRGCDAYAVGIWSAEDARWTWGPIVDLDSPEAVEWWQKVKAAALNTGGDYARGSHCRSCYSRFQCPAYALPPSALEGSLAVIQEGAMAPREKVAQLVLDIQRAEDTLESAKKWAKDWVSVHGSVVLGEKKWGPIKVSGRPGLDKAGLLEAYPDAKRFWKQGEPSAQYRWTKA